MARKSAEEIRSDFARYRRDFLSRLGIPVAFKMYGAGTTIITTAEGQERKFKFAALAKDDDGFVVTTTTGDKILLAESDGHELESALRFAEPAQRSFRASNGVGKAILYGAAGLVAIIVIGGVLGSLLPQDAPARITPPAVADVDPGTPAPVSPPAPRGLAAANSAIKSVSVDHSTVTVTADIGDAFDDEGLINNVAVTAWDVARYVKDGAPEASGAKTIKMVFTSDLTDRLGKVSNGTVLVLSFSADDFRQANYANLSAMGIMNLATDKRVFAPVMAGVAKWCQHNADRAENFCSF